MGFGGLPGLSGPLPDELVIVRHGVDEYALDVLALLSNYRCIYGQGCQGVTPPGGESSELYVPHNPAVTGCCRTVPEFQHATAEVAEEDAERVDSPLRIKPYVEALRPDEAQHYDQINAGDWYSEVEQSSGWESQNAGVGGNCIFLNTDGPEGKLGCALYHLAGRLGIDPKETRPQVCHIEPAAAFVIAEGLASGGRRVLVTLRPAWYGWFASDRYWCTSDPAAYSATEPAFRGMASQYEWLLGEDVFATLSPVLEELWEQRREHYQRNWGRPVPLETPRWGIASITLT